MVNSKKRKKLKRKNRIISTIECTKELQKIEDFNTFYDAVQKDLLEKLEKEKERMRLLGYEFKGVQCLEIETS